MRRGPGVPAHAPATKSAVQRFTTSESLEVGMKILPIASALLLTALVSGARAHLVPPSPTATLVNFDDIDLGGVQQIPFLVVTDQYVNRGVQFAGFGQNSGGLFNPSF